MRRAMARADGWEGIVAHRLPLRAAGGILALAVLLTACGEPGEQSPVAPGGQGNGRASTDLDPRQGIGSSLVSGDDVALAGLSTSIEGSGGQSQGDLGVSEGWHNREPIQEGVER